MRCHRHVLPPDGQGGTRKPSIDDNHILAENFYGTAVIGIAWAGGRRHASIGAKAIVAPEDGIPLHLENAGPSELSMNVLAAARQPALVMRGPLRAVDDRADDAPQEGPGTVREQVSRCGNNSE